MKPVSYIYSLLIKTLTLNSAKETNKLVLCTSTQKVFLQLLTAETLLPNKHYHLSPFKLISTF